jgi:hypothetical protein
MKIKQFLLSIAVLSVSTLTYGQDKIGQVLITNKKVEAERQETTVPLKRRSEIIGQDLVKTGEGARAQFKLDDGTVFTLGESTELLVDTYLYQAKEGDTAVFTLTKGVFRAVTGGITKNNDPKFTVITPMGSIGIRGTDFWGGYLDEDNVDIVLLEGEHEIVIENQYGKSVITNVGEGVTIKPGQPPTQPKKWGEAKLSRAVKTITIPEAN